MDHFSQRVLERYNVNINRNHKRKINLSIQGKNKLYKVIFWRKVTNRITLWLVNNLTALMRPFLVEWTGFFDQRPYGVEWQDRVARYRVDACPRIAPGPGSSRGRG